MLHGGRGYREGIGVEVRKSRGLVVKRREEGAVWERDVVAISDRVRERDGVL